MKRTLAVILLICLLLGACGNNAETPVSTGETVATTVETTAETQAATQPVALEDGSYRHPLTGERLTEPSTARPVAVVINNIKACLPQHGISKADIFYEIETEGGITRCLAIFTDLGKVGVLGPVRSSRTYFNHLSTAYDAPLIHCGGSPKAKKGMYDEKNKLEQWNHIDQMSNGKYFYRDQKRLDKGFNLEHTLFTTGEKLTSALEARKYDMVVENGVSYGLQFAETPEFTGSSAKEILVEFRGSRSTEMKFDEATGLYLATQWYKTTEKTHIDGETNEQISYRNVIVLLADQWTTKEGKVTRSYYQLTGTGKGYFACDGKIVPIKWSHDKVTNAFSYTLEDGTPLTLGVGRTYIAVTSATKGAVTAK